MTLRKTLVLIPSHSLDDFPTELGEAEASGLLNAFVVAFHPNLLAQTECLPLVHRSDTPPEDVADTLVILPECCHSWLPHRWEEHAQEQGATILTSSESRTQLIQDLQILPGQPPQPEDIDDDLTNDFLAFGMGYLQVELLTRRMHYYSNLDSGPVESVIVSAAHALLRGDHEQTRKDLHRAFEQLLDARERFFPVESYLIDLCLLIPRLADSLQSTLSPDHPSTLLATAQDWQSISDSNPELVQWIASEWDHNHLGVIGGEESELPINLLPTQVVIESFETGQSIYKSLFRQAPTVWARRKFGLNALMPRILNRAGLPFAMHVALDDGIYPDDEASKLRWEGADGSAVDAFSRIPLAADSATSFLRFSQRMAESMEEDIAAAVMFARWPEIQSPWFEDFRRIHNYAPVLGRFIPLDRFFRDTEPPGRVFPHKSQDYFAPYLTHAVARDSAHPIRRFSRAIQNAHNLTRDRWFSTIHELLSLTQSESIHKDDTTPPYNRNLIDPDQIDVTTQSDNQQPRLSEPLSLDQDFLDAELRAIRSSNKLTHQIVSESGDEEGLLVVNSLSFPRNVTVPWPNDWLPPSLHPPITAIQIDNNRRQVSLDMPAAGFQWLPRPDAPPSRVMSGPQTATDHILRNEFFEVHISEETGGIAYIKGYGRSPKRLAQNLAFRFPRKQSPDGTGPDPNGTYYVTSECDQLSVTCSGPALGEIVTTGRIQAPGHDKPLATFTQITRLRRGQSHVEIELTLNVEQMPAGDPWSNYFACRFAWSDESALITRDIHECAQPAPDSRFDACHYIEITQDELRTTIVPLDTPFHRRTGDRMLDSLLVVAGETSNAFRFHIACDEPYPLRAAYDSRTPALACIETTGPPPSGTSGWFFHIDSKNVQIIHVENRRNNDQRPVLVIRLMETEGRGRVTRLACFQTPEAARIVDLQGETMAELSVEGNAILVDMNPFEIATVHLEFPNAASVNSP